MKNKTAFFLITTVLAMTGLPAHAAVKMTALTINSGDSTGKIQGAGGHRFKTTNHGGQPAIFLVDGDDPNGPIINGPDLAHNGINLPVNAGRHTYTIYAEKYNSYTWAYYTLQVFFDLSDTPQISVLAPLNTDSTQIFPPVSANQQDTENLAGFGVKSPKSLVYKSGQTEVRLTSFHFSQPTLYNKDRVSPFEVKSNKVLDYVGEFTLEVTAPPTISAGGVVNGASFAPKIAPGALFSIFGTDLATSVQGATTLPLPTSLGGTSVTVGGKAAPLVYVSATQINAQMPYEVAEGGDAQVIVTVNGLSSPVAMVSIVPAAPGIFQFGEKRAVVQNQDYTVNDANNGAASGSMVVAYLTGTGRVDHAVPTGNGAASDPLSRLTGLATATVNNTGADIVFAGMTPGFVGLTQVNLMVPSMAPGTYPLVISVNGEKSNAAMITVK